MGERGQGWLRGACRATWPGRRSRRRCRAASFRRPPSPSARPSTSGRSFRAAVAWQSSKPAAGSQQRRCCCSAPQTEVLLPCMGATRPLVRLRGAGARPGGRCAQSAGPECARAAHLPRPISPPPHPTPFFEKLRNGSAVTQWELEGTAGCQIDGEHLPTNLRHRGPLHLSRGASETASKIAAEGTLGLSLPCASRPIG